MTDLIPLPDTAYKQNWRENEVDKMVRNQDYSETDDDETIEKQWRIDTECAHCLVSPYSDKDRNEHNAQQPCELSKQA
jgi:hypothetical protein